MARAARRILSLLAIAVLCASCRVDVNVNVVMQLDGSGVVTITAVADAAVVKAAPSLATDLRFDDVKTAGWTVVGPTAEANGGLRVLLTKAFQTSAQATEILANVSGPDGPLVGIALARDHTGALTTFHLNGTLRVTGGMAAFSDATLLSAVGATPYARELAAAGVQPADAVGVTFTAALPGAVKSSSGAATAGVLTWTVPADGSAVDVATITQDKAATNTWAGPLANGALIALAVWLFASAAVLVYVIVAHRRRSAVR